MPYAAPESRYSAMAYRRCGRSGLLLPALSLGFWHNFGGGADYAIARAIARRAFDLGIVHFDLADNYGPPPGSAEETLGRLVRDDFGSHRDELVISTKAGHPMWPGPYGDWGSRKHLLAGLDASLRRMGLEYVDIFYHHRPDPAAPLEESMGALAQAVRSGKALYAGVSKYPPDLAREAARILRGMGVPLLIHQGRYNMLDRELESGLLDACAGEGVGVIAFMPLAQGLLSSRYLEGLPPDSRAAGPSPFLKAEGVTPDRVAKARALNDIARARGQSLAQLAVAWALRDGRVTSALVGASRPSQVEENARALDSGPLSAEELAAIDRALAG